MRKAGGEGCVGRSTWWEFAVWEEGRERGVLFYLFG